MTIYMSSIAKVSDSLNSIINGFNNLSKESLKIQELIHFLDISSNHQTIGTEIPIVDKNSTIEFKDVSFKYPGSERYALKNISVKIKIGDKVCIVGENGAGKTTFVNLLTRLYAPTSGEILLDGTNIQNFDIIAYRRLFSPVLQDFCLYELSLADNIVLDNTFNQKLLDDTLEKSNLNEMVNQLPKKYHTTIGKMADAHGVIPSGGEAQKIAIARALYRDTPIVILDEPTAALDPLSEYEIYTQFHKMIRDKTAILITHRLSAVQLSDVVAVLCDGKIIEFGTHAELHAKGGIYREMFDKQAQFYISNAESSDTEQ